MTGIEAVQRLIARAGLYGIKIEGVQGNRTDNYDPRTKGTASIPGCSRKCFRRLTGGGCHELGHAQQGYAEGYFPLRSGRAGANGQHWLLPGLDLDHHRLFLNYAGNALGVNLAWLGVAIFAWGAVFRPGNPTGRVECFRPGTCPAGRDRIISGPDEQRGVSTVLNAAALTYVAALITAVLQLLYYVMLVGGLGGGATNNLPVK